MNTKTSKDSMCTVHVFLDDRFYIDPGADPNKRVGIIFHRSLPIEINYFPELLDAPSEIIDNFVWWDTTNRSFQTRSKYIEGLLNKAPKDVSDSEICLYLFANLKF